MALAFDSSSSANTQAGGASSSVTFAHTVVASNCILIVTVNNGFGATRTCTYNGVAMTHPYTFNNGAGDQDVFYLVNPASGTHNIVYSQTSAGNYLIQGLALSGATGSTTASNFQQNFVTPTTTPTAPITTVNSGAFVVTSLLDQNPPSTGTPTTTDSSTAYASNGIAGIEQSIGSYISKPVGGTSYTPGWSVPGSANSHLLVAFEVSSSAAAAPTGNFLVMMG